MRRIFSFARGLRNAGAEALQLSGFAAVAYGVELVAGHGVAFVVGGVLLVLLAIQVER